MAHEPSPALKSGSGLYLLDTNIISDLRRHPHGRIATKIAEVGEQSIAISILVAAELRFGALKKGSANLADQIEALLGAIEVIPFEPPADVAYAEVRVALEAKGAPISNNDLLIAAHALALGRVLVTDNVREFRRVKGLTVENWLR